jgi:predicted Zn-dependent protease
MGPGRAGVALLGVLLACASPGDPPLDPAAAGVPPRAEPALEPATPAYDPHYERASACTRPSVEDRDRAPACVHVTPSDMPLRIAIGYPRVPARYGSRKSTRAAAVEGIQLWETALQPRLPWFRLEFVEQDDSAPVQVEWKRRLTGKAAGRGWLEWSVGGDHLRVVGRMEVTTQPYLPDEIPLELPEVRMLLAHEFGHVLGLGHSLSEDSAMSYAWHTRERILVTSYDVDSFVTLVSQPNGLRTDGRPVLGLAP